MNQHRIAEMHALEQDYWWHKGKRFIIRNLFFKYCVGHNARAVAQKAAGGNGVVQGHERKVKPHSTRNAVGKARILDVGCGTGSNFSVLQMFGEVTGLDSSPVVRDYLQQQGFRCVVSDAQTLTDIDDQSFDAVTAFDVLEHLDNDAMALRSFARVLADGGSLLLTVPAYQWLWSEHDVALDHHRRYTARQLRKRVEAAGF